jgi:hypothetical protein
MSACALCLCIMRNFSGTSHSFRNQPFQGVCASGMDLKNPERYLVPQADTVENRPRYRAPRKERAVRVYSIAQESRHAGSSRRVRRPQLRHLWCGGSLG